MKKFFAILSIAALAFAACDPNNETDEPQLPSAAGITPVVTVAENVATFSLPDGTTGLIPIWYTNESGDFVFAGNGNNFTKTFFVNGTFKVRMYVSNANGQSKDYAEAEFTINATMEWNGFNYDSEFNLWKAAEGEAANTYTWYAPGWAEVAGHSASVSNGTYKVSFPTACAGQWQAQVHVVPDNQLDLSAEKHYDFSCIVKINKLCGGVTFKFVEQGGGDHDNVFLFNVQEDMPEGTNIFYMTDVPGVDISAAKMVFDFGWCQDGTEVEISRITLKDHANNDGTTAPEKEEPVEPQGNYPADNFAWDVNGAGNLWKAAIGNENFFYYHCTNGGDWNGTPTESTTVPFLTKNSNSYALNLEGNTAGDWMNQFFMFPNAGSFIALDAAKKYAFKLTLSSNVATKAFFKLEQYADKSGDTAASDEDKMKHEGALIWEWGRKDIPAGEDTVIIAEIIENVACDNINLVFDFGGNPANTVITIKDICLQEYNK